MLKIYKAHFEHNQYFKMLFCGVSYKISDVTFIGDTGWTSFDKGKGVINLNTKIIDLPEEKQIKDFSYKKIFEYHTKWIEYANSILDTNEKVIVLTHFPMFCIAKKNSDLWWSSVTNISKKNNYWNIHGHTHKNYQNENLISYQRGYKNMSKNPSFYDHMSNNYYLDKHIGKLIRLSETKYLIDPSNYILNRYFQGDLLSAENNKEIIKVKQRGFKRCSANKRVFAALSSNPAEFISYVESTMHGYRDNVFINYTADKGLTNEEITTIENAIKVLKK